MASRPQLSPQAVSRAEEERTTVRYAGFLPRFLAYLLDILPILSLCTFISYSYLGFGELWRVYREQPGDLESRVQFLAARNLIRDTTFLLWLIYSTVFEASRWQGTVGKRLLRICVCDQGGNRLTLGRSVRRNLAKLLSYLSLGLGFLWAAFSKNKQAWHDRIANSFVVHRL